jgi:hypothetical protein
MEPVIAQALVGSGPLGLLILYLMFERKFDKADRKEQDQKRMEADDRRTTADLKMAAAITALAIRITGKPNGDLG